VALYGISVGDLEKINNVKIIQGIKALAKESDIVLTGSRFFKTESHTSDWDFIIGSSIGLPNAIRYFGYEEKEQDIVTDPRIKSLYSSEINSSIYYQKFGDTHIDLQIVTSNYFLDKIAVQYFIREKIGMIASCWSKMGHTERSFFWNYSILLYQEKERLSDLDKSDSYSKKLELIAGKPTY
jgi:hypothetical protein